MKHNLMKVNLSTFGTITVDTKHNTTKLGDVIAVCNNAVDDKTIDIDTIFSSKAFWYAAFYENRKMSVAHDVYTPMVVMDDLRRLTIATTSDNTINYNSLIHEVPNVIKITNRGIWVSINLLPAIINITESRALMEMVLLNCVDCNIINMRKSGAKSFKRLNVLIDTLVDRYKLLQPGGNKECYIEISRIIKRKLGIDKDCSEWDGTTRSLIIHTKRTKLQKDLCRFIDTGLVKTYDDLKMAIVQYNMVDK